MKAMHLWIALLLSVLAAGYSVLGWVMTVWLSVVPGNSPERVLPKLVFWIAATILFSVSSVWLAVRLRARQQR